MMKFKKLLAVLLLGMLCLGIVYPISAQTQPAYDYSSFIGTWRKIDPDQLNGDVILEIKEVTDNRVVRFFLDGAGNGILPSARPDMVASIYNNQMHYHFDYYDHQGPMDLTFTFYDDYIHLQYSRYSHEWYNEIIFVSSNVKPKRMQQDSDYSVLIDGQPVAFDVPPQAINGRTMVPLRAIFEGLGATVNWVGSTQTITATKGSTNIQLAVNQPVMYVNGTPITLDVPSRVIGGRTLVPVRAISEAFGCFVDYEPRNQTVVIDTDNTVPLYTPDGKEGQASREEVASYKAMGWYLTPFEKVTIYTLDGRSAKIYQSELPAYTNAGWYTEPMAKVYAKNGKSAIVPLAAVKAYRSVGWYPMHEYLMFATYQEATLHFGPFAYDGYYDGTPNSGDLSGKYYHNTPDSPVYIPYIFFANADWCNSFKLTLKDVFPYLALYADENGNISMHDIDRAFSNSGIYGVHYRDGDGDYSQNTVAYHNHSSSPLKHGDTLHYWFDYDYTQMYIIAVTTELGYKAGYVNINTSWCSFSVTY